MQSIVDMLQIAALSATALLGILLLITLLRLRKVKTTTRKLRIEIEEGHDI